MTLGDEEAPLEDFRAVHGVSAREPLGGTNGDAFRGSRASGNVLSIITRDETCQRRSCRLCLMRIDFRIAFPREPGITDTLVLSRDLWRPHVGAPRPGGHQISDLPHAAGAEARSSAAETAAC